MTTIQIDINCAGEHCGNCRYQTCAGCIIFDRSFEEDGERLSECLAAQVDSE